MDAFKKFATKRVFLGFLLAIAVLWLSGTALELVKQPDHQVLVTPPMGEQAMKSEPLNMAPIPETLKSMDGYKKNVTPEVALPAKAQKASEAVPPPQPAVTKPIYTPALPNEKAGALAPANVVPTKKVVGLEFASAIIKPLSYELNERFWGWRPNDILDFTDNVNNFQLGVLEVTRRSIVILTERISRSGTVESLDKNLEHAMDWLMTKPDRYWLPTPESRYNDALKDIETYKKKLEKGEAAFYIRPVNLLPLLATYANLLGSCDENLAKTKEADGEYVSFFRADDYFYYSQGVASALAVILEAVLIDFKPTLETRHGAELLRQAIKYCHKATKIEPWIILDSDFSSFFANHRANMAAPISHARFYLDLLVATLST